MKTEAARFRVKKLQKKDLMDFKKLIQVFHEVFEMKNSMQPDSPYLNRLLAKPGFIVFRVCRGDEIIGGLTAYELPMYYSKQPEIFIYDMAIKPEFQRKGLGKKLLSALKKYGRQKGISTVFVAANEEDRHALDFYHSAGGKAEKVIHFNFLIRQRLSDR